MSNLLRFGSKTELGSPREIEDAPTTTGGAIDAAGRDLAPVAMTADARRLLVGDLAAKHGISQDRVAMLVDRFGTARGPLEGAAQDLRIRKTD